MSSFGRNIATLREANAANTSLANQYETQNATAIGSRKRYEAGQIADGLSNFSKSLKDWKTQNIKDELAKGQREFIQEKQVNAEKMAALQERLAKAQDNEIEIQQIKSEMLKLSGPDGMAEADRIGHLSPWAQVGFVREKLKLFNNSYEDKLTYHMQNSERAISLQGLTFTPKQLRDHNITGLPMKEAALEVVSQELMKDAGINKYSAEMLQLAGTYDAINKAKEKQLSKFRERYNIDASAKKQAQLLLDWEASEKTGKDLWQLVLSSSNTVNAKNQLLGMAGGWDFALAQLAKEGIAATDRGAYVEMISNIVLPDELADKLGVPHGTKFGKQWPKRIEALRATIKKGFTDNVKAEEGYLKSLQTDVGNKFQKRAQEGPIDEKELREWEKISEALGGTLDNRIKNYRTLSDIDEEDSKQAILDYESSKGFITNAYLDTQNPRAASEFREKADRYEKAMDRDFSITKDIEAALNQAWTEAGLKHKEKSTVWTEARRRALADFDRKFMRLVDMGFDRETAIKIAKGADGDDLVHPVTKEPIPALADFEGVVSEIKKNGASTKYAQELDWEKDEYTNGLIRFHEVDKATKEIAQANVEGKLLHTYIVGGDYGERMIQSIIEKVDTYGIWGAIRKSPEAFKYYESIAHGRRGWNPHGIIDAQLKAAGHPGIWPERRLPTDDEKLDANVNQAEEKISSIINQTNTEGGSLVAYNQLSNDIDDLRNLRTSQPSVWNQPNNLTEVLA